MANINRITTPNGVTYDLVKKELTLAQYNALSTAEKNNGTVYLITDTGEIISNSVVYSGGASSLDDLTDVTLTNPAANETLVCEIVNNDPVFKNKATTWTGTQAEYNALAVKDPNVTYYITDGDGAARYIMCTQSQYNVWKTAGTLEADTPYYVTDANNSSIVIDDTVATADTVWSGYKTNQELSLKQNVTDSSLTTSATTIVGAINELASRKADIGNLFFGSAGTGFKSINGETTIDKIIDNNTTSPGYFSIDHSGYITNLTTLYNRQFIYGWTNANRLYSWCLICTFGGIWYCKRENASTYTATKLI